MKIMGNNGLPKQFSTMKSGLPFGWEDLRWLDAGTANIDRINHCGNPNTCIAVDSSQKLFISDGTDDGTKIIGDGSLYNYPHNFLKFLNKALFISDNQLTISDGTDSGTYHLIGDSNEIIRTENILTQTDDTVYFTGRDSSNYNILSIYSTNGVTITKTCDITNGAALLAVTENYVFFSYASSATGKELWVDDKSNDSFHIVKDILTGTGSALEGTSVIATFDNKVVFSAYVNANTKALFVSDGTELGTIKICDGLPASEILLNNVLVFSNETGVHSVNLSLQNPTILDLNTTAVNVQLKSDLDQVFFKNSANDLFVATGQLSTKLAENVLQFQVLEENAI